MRTRLVVAFLGVTACSGKDAEPVDTASSVDSAAGVETYEAGPAADSLTGSAAIYPPADASGNLTGETRKKSGGFGQDPPAPTIGRDSAFGPIGTMDSLGNRGPIRK